MWPTLPGYNVKMMYFGGGIMELCTCEKNCLLIYSWCGTPACLAAYSQCDTTVFLAVQHTIMCLDRIKTAKL